MLQEQREAPRPEKQIRFDSSVQHTIFVKWGHIEWEKNGAYITIGSRNYPHGKRSRGKLNHKTRKNGRVYKGESRKRESEERREEEED